MRYELRMSAYDVMDQIWVTLSLHSQQDVAEGAADALAHISTTVAGVGESDPREWMRDALVAALEVL